MIGTNPDTDEGSGFNMACYILMLVVFVMVSYISYRLYVRLWFKRNQPPEGTSRGIHWTPMENMEGVPYVEDDTEHFNEEDVVHKADVQGTR